jgi:hypothetical protein
MGCSAIDASVLVVPRTYCRAAGAPRLNVHAQKEQTATSQCDGVQYTPDADGGVYIAQQVLRDCRSMREKNRQQPVSVMGGAVDDSVLMVASFMLCSRCSALAGHW